MAKTNLTLGEKTIHAGLELYDRFADRKTMPTNRRVFLESVLDKSKNPITEQSFTPEELGTLGEIIFGKYKNIQPALDAYEKHLVNAMASHNAAVAAKNKDRIMYPMFAERYAKDLAAINAYKKGKLTPEFIKLAAGQIDHPRSVAFGNLELHKPFNVKPAVMYEDYGIDPKEARTVSSGADPRASLHTTLGRFTYEIDPKTGSLVIVDKYDFNAPTTSKQSSVAPFVVSENAVALAPDTGGSGMYQTIRNYAGRVLPEGYGRDVRVQLNNLAPVVNNALSK
jgi:hypothetical protein